LANAMPDVIRSWVHYHWEMWNFHQNLHPTASNPKYGTHPYQSHPLGWLPLVRPVSYFYTSPKAGVLGCTAAKGCAKEILGIGTPALWWASIPALFAMVWFWIAKRDWRAGAALFGVLFAILPWVWDDTVHHRTMFLFYALPAVPFMVIALTLWIGYAIGPPDASPARRQWGVTAAGAYLGLVVVNFFWLYPILAAQVIPYSHWQDRIWFGSWI
jgi:dolichyl-phosphate-mannose-protein mannosyltransferase